MDLASGYSDSINYGNGYTPLADNAIGNNNADYLRNQLAVAQAGQYDPFAQSGGFGAMTAAYAGAGADYGRAVGGGGNIYAPSGGGGGGPSVFETGTNPYGVDTSTWNGMSPGDRATFNRAMGGGIGSDAARAPNQPAITPQQTYVGGFDPYASSSFGPSVQKNVGSAGQGNAPYQFPGMDKIQPQPTDYSQIPSGIFDGNFRAQPQGNTATMFDGLSAADMATWQRAMYAAGKGSEIPNQQQQPQPQQNRAPVQGGMTDPFWQGIRDMMGADPKDQSRLPQGGAYPGATNPNYQPGGMAPQQPTPWLNAS